MSWISEQADTRQIHESDLPDFLRYVVSRLLRAKGILTHSLRVFQTERIDRKYVVSFDFSWDRPARIRDARIERPEKVALWFHAGEGFTTPPQARADRSNFPNDLPHLNPKLAGEPAWFCLAQEGLTEVYARRGVEPIVERLNSWLRDAAISNLEYDGWEATPRNKSNFAELDVESFQKIASKGSAMKAGRHAARAFAIPVFTNTNEEANPYLQLFATKRTSIEEFQDEIKRPIPCVFAWGPKGEPIDDRFLETVTDTGELLYFAQAAGCLEQLEKPIRAIRRRMLVIQIVFLIGVWRPKHLRGYSAQSEGAKLEITGFLYRSKKDQVNNRFLEKIVELQLLSSSNSASLKRMSGKDTPDRAIAIIGAGALGSKVIEHLVREGALSVHIVDHDFFLPHNVARHSLTSCSVFLPKVAAVGHRLTHINPGCQIKPVFKDVTKIQSLPDEVLEKNTGVIIDSSADTSAMRRLCANDNYARVAKIELARDGYSGLLFAEGKGRSPRVDDLKFLLPLLAHTEPSLHHVLDADGDHTSIDIGIGCGSASMIIPDSRISLHAANFVNSLQRFIRLETEEARIGVFNLDEEGNTKGWTWFIEPPVRVLGNQGNDGQWEIRVRNQVINEIQDHLLKSSPRETGGYLIGHYDFILRTVYILAITLPEPIQASPQTIVLPRPPTSLPLPVLGTWHTHPNSSSKPSQKDLEQFDTYRNLHATGTTPHVMLIYSGNEELNANMVIPDLWTQK